MNAIEHTFKFELERHQVLEAVGSLFHTILFLRSCRKHFNKVEPFWDNMSLFEDVDCDFFELTYIRCCSLKLKQHVEEEISKFCNQLLEDDAEKTGKISLEFYRLSKSLFGQEQQHVWEVWNIEVEIVSFRTTMDRDIHREQTTELITNAIIEINRSISNNNYIPDLESILDTRFDNVQPYLFNILYETTPVSPSVSSMLWRFMFGNSFFS
ncbi:Autophagy-related protein 101 [Blattella germanica]|nr:Autophagy-related protein 101 [Blattella germanica]